MFKLAPVNPWILLSIVGAILLSATIGYWRGSTNTRNSIEADIARENQIAQITYDNALRATASEIAKIEIVNKTITQELEREVRIEPVYLDCSHSDDVKRLLDSVLTGQAPSESVTKDKLSAADKAD